jgi:hypothetical protein
MFLENTDPKMYRFEKISFLQCLDDLHLKIIFHKQSGSDIKVKVGSGSEINNFGSTTLDVCHLSSVKSPESKMGMYYQKLRWVLYYQKLR